MKDNLANKLLLLVKRNYQEIANSFNLSRQKKLWPEIINLSKEIKTGDSILDVGCGNGRLLKTLTDKRIEYLGVDNSPKLLALAKKNYPQNKFLLGDLLNLRNVSRKNFSHIFCLAVWQHIPSTKLRLQSLKELKNKLLPGGKIIISIWNLWSVKNKNFSYLIIKNYLLSLLSFKEVEKMDFGDLIFPWKDSRGQEISDRYYHAFNKLEIHYLVYRAGLKIVSLKKDKFNYWLILKQ